MQKLLSLVRRAVEDYGMIREHDRIAVGLSGGKDSFALLLALWKLREFYPVPFDVVAVTVDMGFPGMDFSATAAYLSERGIPYHTAKTGIGPLIFDIRKEKNPCSLCARMRRGSLHDAAKALGCRTVALGHHMDDAVETFFLSLFYEGRLSCFQPSSYLSRKDLTVIRPMILADEDALLSAIRPLDLPIVKSTCPMDGVSKRQDMREYIRSLERTYPDIRTRVFGAIRRSPLRGYGGDSGGGHPETE